ncbi:AMP-binding protein [Thalassobaculum sp.]|uniref:phenylacetate--CoA ligase family protein n=1 Tax=Thalassobaculum sp. TaxID=2022740 RepID=UPI0032EEC6E1
MAEYYDELETRSADARAAWLAEALPRQIAHARAKSAHFGRSLKDIDPAVVTDRAALAALPVIRKSDLQALQQAEPPLGGLNATSAGDLARVFMSPGPIFEPEGHGPDGFRFARALFAAGFRKGELVHNTFAYHLTPAGRICESGAHALGCPVFPAGVGNTEQQVQAIAALKPRNYVGTPSFLRIILEKAKEIGADVSSLRHALVSGEALPPSLRADLAGYGVAVLQAYATADVGLIAYESEAKEGLIVDEGAVVEIVRPGTGDPVPDGEVGEVVVTVFNPDYPLVRFGTGDMSAVLAGASPCGRTNMRIKGWMGRADQTTKIKGMFVHPSQVAEIVKRHPEIDRARLEVTGEKGQDSMALLCEVAGAPEGLADAIGQTLTAVTKLRGAVKLVAKGDLPNDGKVIADLRSYE